MYGLVTQISGRCWAGSLRFHQLCELSGQAGRQAVRQADFQKRWQTGRQAGKQQDESFGTDGCSEIIY